MVCGPEIVRCVNELKTSLPYHHHEDEYEYKHHEQTGSRQQRFSSLVLIIVQVISNMGNPFLETSGDLLVLDTSNIVNENVVTTVNSIETLGNDQFRNFIKDANKKFIPSFQKNELPLFSQATTKKM